MNPAICAFIGLSLFGCNAEEPKKPASEVVKRVIVPCGAKEVNLKEHRIEVVGKGVSHNEETYIDGQLTAVKTRQLSHCIPCDKVKSADEKFACEGGSK
jgi:hypothetical protein